MSTRKTLLKLTEEGVKAVKLPFKLRKEKKQLESWTIDYEEKVETLGSDITDLKCKEELDVEAILDKVDEKELAERRLKQGTVLMDELFGDEGDKDEATDQG